MHVILREAKDLLLPAKTAGPSASPQDDESYSANFI
jgi:hypothetical protein